MQSLSLHTSKTSNEPLDLAGEIARLEALVMDRQRELAGLQEEMRVFRARYTEIVGSRLSELSEVEREIERAEARLVGLETEDDVSSDEKGTDEPGEQHDALPVRKAMRKLFWAVARMFHPDHASDEQEAQRRHTIMAEASRAYSEGDVESLHTLLGDEELQSLCAVGASGETDDLETKLLGLEIELRTAEFGIKRIKLNGLYRTKLKVDEEAAQGRDALAQQAEQLDRQITKARRRLEHLS